MFMQEHLIPGRRFILAEESSFFEAKFRSPEFSGADGSIELRDIDGATLVGFGLELLAEGQGKGVG